MSATTIDNPITTTVRQEYLRDYNIRLTGGDQTQEQQKPAPPQNTDGPRPQVENPPNWYDEHRAVPPYRPVNTNLDLSQRPWGQNPVEMAFVYTMLHGVWLTGSLSWVWRQTGGRLNNTFFRYKVGGEV